ncbi:MAG: Gfo/Idh/MocA family oxidoreductase [Candidatus Brocadiia bacterium]
MRFIQVGVGGFGRGWVGHVVDDADAQLSALVDVDPEALEAARQQVGLPENKCYSDFRRAFSEVEADAVLCVTPPAVHHEVAVAALKAGLHVLTEKPLADTMAHARQMVDAAEAAGLTLMVSQNYRFQPWVRTVQELVKGEDFGPPDCITLRFEKAPRFARSFRLKMEHPLVQDMSIHHFDLMRAITGREPVSVYAETWRPSWSWFEHDPCATALFHFEGGLRVIYYGSWVTRGAETSWPGHWRIECPQAAVEVQAGQVHVTPAEQADQHMEVELSGMASAGQAGALREFQQAIAGGRAPETSGRDNLNSLAMVFAVMASAERGEPVRLEELTGAI